MDIQTSRLRIRRVVEEDWRSIQGIWEDFNRSELAQYDRPHNTEESDVRRRIKKWASTGSGYEHIFFSVCREDVVIGYISCNIREQGYELGYCFHSAYHGKGYAKESHLAVLQYLRERGVRFISAGTALKNKPSVKLLRSLGFRCVGTERVSFYQDADGNDIVFDGGLFELDLQNM